MAKITDSELAKYFGFGRTPEEAESYFSGQMRQAAGLNAAIKLKLPGFSKPAIKTDMLSTINLGMFDELKNPGGQKRTAERAGSIAINISKTCPGCHARITGGKTFCAGCGAKL